MLAPLRLLVNHVLSLEIMFLKDLHFLLKCSVDHMVCVLESQCISSGREMLKATSWFASNVLYLFRVNIADITVVHLRAI